ncbi:hypothetical protein C8J57DRAFT_1510198 [Mycena rebaudengoi]|nr:hypothetical protein C8J57DRAFT_1510198 [Mycena rebaudengoi]
MPMACRSEQISQTRFLKSRLAGPARALLQTEAFTSFLKRHHIESDDDKLEGIDPELRLRTVRTTHSAIAVSIVARRRPQVQEEPAPPQIVVLGVGPPRRKARRSPPRHGMSRKVYVNALRISRIIGAQFVPDNCH